MHDYNGNEVEENSESQSVERYLRLCQMLISWLMKLLFTSQPSGLMHETIYGLYIKVMEMRSTEHDQENRNNAKISSVFSSVLVSRKISLKGLKEELGRTSTKTKKTKP